MSASQPIAPTGNEQVRRRRSSSPMTLAPGDIVCEHLASGRMHRDQPIFTELGAADRQYAGLQIDVFELEIARFTQTESGYGEQTEEAIVDSGQQRTAFTVIACEGNMERGVQELFDLSFRIQVRPRPLCRERQQACRRDLRARIRRAAITCELADVH